MAGTPRTPEWSGGNERMWTDGSQSLSGLSALRPALRLTPPEYLIPLAHTGGPPGPTQSIPQDASPSRHLVSLKPLHGSAQADHLIKPVSPNLGFRGNSHI